MSPEADALPSLFPAVRLRFPAGDFHSSYERVRRDPRLGPALQASLLPALERAGDPERRLSDFEKARLGAIRRYYQSAAQGEPYLLPEEQHSRATGTGPHPALDALDRVSFDLVDAWFQELAREVAAAPASLDARLSALRRLERLALGATPWKPHLGELVALGVELRRHALERGEPAEA